MIRRWTAIHKRLRHDGETRVHDVGFVYVENKVWIFNEINPKPKRKWIAFPRVDHFGVGYAVLQSLVVHEIEHVLDGERKCWTSMSSTEYSLKKVIDKLLERALRCQ